MNENYELPFVEALLRYKKKIRYNLNINQIKTFDKNEIIRRINYCIKNSLIYNERYFDDNIKK